MPYGYNGKILHIDLTTKKISIETPDENFYRSYMGGCNIGAYYLLKELKPGIDALSPDNMIVVSASIVTGITSPGFSRFNVAAKSPLTGGYGEGQSGGYWGAELKFAGFDAIVIKGKSDSPCYLYISNGSVEIKDARNLWGKDIKEVQQSIIKENDDNKIKVLAIGIGGENMVRYASIISDLKHAIGRTGMGAVFGSKNLKAIAVRGKIKVKVKEPEVLKEANNYFREHVKDNPSTRDLNIYGTSAIVQPYNLIGQLPSYNFKTTYFEHAEEISGEKMYEGILQKNEGCFACPVKCKRIVKASGKYDVDPEYGGPEFETIASFGSNCGVSDLEAIAYANQLCNMHTVDTISAGSCISFAMECYENGLINKKDTDGLDLKFGNADAMIEMVKKIAARDGFGNILAEGVKIASQKIGKGSEKFAMHTKGGELPYHAPRGKGMLALSYALSPLGGDHIVCEHDTDFDFSAPDIFLEQVKCLGLLERLETDTYDEKKLRMFCYLQDHFSFMDTLCLCVLAFAPVRVFKMQHLVNIISAVTGWETSLWELMKLGEKRINLARCFNVREGMDNKDDTLPDRFFEAITTGARKGKKLDRDKFDYAKKLYYRMRNWDERGIPTKALLYELDLGWVIDNLESFNIKMNL